MHANHLLLMSLFAPLFLHPGAAAENSIANPSNAVAEKAFSPDSNAGALSWRVSKIIGTHVKNAADENVGEVNDLIVDWRSREIIAIVISTGAYLGVADNFSTVTPDVLKYDADARVFRTALTKEDLKKRPKFSSNAWPSFDPETMTPAEQETTQGDQKLTREIRAAVTGAELSSNARNLKITAQGGKVTLHGMVDSEKEHAAVLGIVQRHVDATKITDDLQVKAH